MPRHHAAPTHASTHHHALSSLAVTGAALGASLFSPLTAAAAPGSAESSGQATPSHAATSTRDDTLCDAADAETREGACLPTASHSTIRPRAREPEHRHRHSPRDGGGDVIDNGIGNGIDNGGKHHRARPMTSGERQYRTGCQQGYIVDDCEQFSVKSLLQHGIDPFQ